MTIRELVETAHQAAVEKGFYDKPREFGTAVALMHSELSEALEAHRTGQSLEAVAEEFADVVIRVADTCGYLGIDLEEAIALKIERNRSRPRCHGKKY